MSGTIDFLERATRQTIAEMLARHRAELAPHLKVLADLEALRPSVPVPILITPAQIDAMLSSATGLIG